MNREPEVSAGEASDHVLPSGCMLCAGDLAVRITAAGAASYCSACHRISRARLVRDEEGMRIVHAGAWA